MRVYILRRLLWLIAGLIVITIIAFVLYYVLPSASPAVVFAGKGATPAVLAATKKNLGLNHPVWIQYLLFLKHLVIGDQYGWPGLGFSYVNHSSVRSLIAGRLVITLTLAVGAAFLWLAISIPLGLLAAVKRGTIWDRASLLGSLFFVSAPVFWLGLTFLWLFWYKLGIAAGTGYYSPAQYGVATWLDHMLMPWITLALLYVAWYARMVRSSVLDTLPQPYIKTAQAKGMTRRRLLVRHVLRASLMPVFTMFGMDFATLIGGTVIVEVVFNLNGIGQLAVQSVTAEDIPVILAVTLLGAFVVMLANLIIDIAYRYLDPRIQYR